MEQFEISVASDFREFELHAKNFLLSDRITIPSSYKIKVQNLGLKRLGLKSMNQVRDRYEGQAFMNRLMLKLSGIYLANKVLKLDINLETLFLEKSEDYFVPINNIEFKLISFYYGTLPIVKIGTQIPLAFCAVKSDFTSGCFFGTLIEYDLNNNLHFKKTNETMLKESFKFIGFDNLNPITKQ